MLVQGSHNRPCLEPTGVLAMPDLKQYGLLTRKLSEMCHDISLGEILLEKIVIELWNGLVWKEH